VERSLWKWDKKASVWETVRLSLDRRRARSVFAMSDRGLKTQHEALRVYGSFKGDMTPQP